MIMTAEEARQKISKLPSEISACYVLWDRPRGVPVYVGTARSPSRLRSHLQKDHARLGNLGKLADNPPFYKYVMRQPIGWLGVSFDMFACQSGARMAEVQQIAQFGMRPSGTLFNRQLRG